jgi:putative membrane protein
MNENSKKGFLYRMLCGAFLGISIVAPGISGSIMAVMMGIYDELINIISNPFKSLKKNIIYCIPLCMGAGLSILAFINLLKLLFSSFPTPAYLLFISLIAGSIPTVFKQARNGFKLKYIIGIAAALAFALTIGMLAKSDYILASDLTQAPDNIKIAFFSFSGAIAGMTSMIPGMSVSMMLMMLGVYEPLLDAASELTKLGNVPVNLLLVLPTGICFVIGMVLFSNLTKIVFRKFQSLAYFMVLGFMSGSLISIFPGLPNGFRDWLLSGAAICIGIGISYLFKRLGQKFNVKEDLIQ